MHQRFTLSFALALLSALSFGQAPGPILEKIRELDRTDSQVMKHLDELVNGIGPRLTSSERLDQACDWAVKKFESFGLKNVRKVQWGTFPVGFDRGVRRGRVTAPVAMDLVFTTPSWTPGTQGTVKASIKQAPENLADLDKNPGEWKGAFLLGVARARGGEERVAREAQFQKLGISGVITKAQSELVLTGGSHQISATALPKIVSISLQGTQYAELERFLADGQSIEAEFEIDNRFRPGPIPLYNVIAEITGTEKPDELVIVGGHIDSWDGATGTTDNGTGTATTIEAARLLALAGAKPRRTIRFMLWSGEEQGLLGSRAYIEQHAAENEKISAVLVHDGGTNYVSGIAATAAMVPDFESVLAPLLTWNKNLPFKIRAVKSLPQGIGSDHDSYLAAGVPGFFWDQGGKANYTRTHHTQYDTYDAAIEEYQRHTSQIVAVGALAIANLPHLLNREGMRSLSDTGARLGRGSRRRLGINPNPDDLSVLEVTPDSAAAKAGMKVGDRILKIDGKAITDAFEMSDSLRAGAPKKVITVLRDGKNLDLTVTWDETPRTPPPSEEKKK
jgi:carboxypeptidase Q